MSQPIKAPCKRDYFPATRTSGTRSLSSIRWIVMHDEEAPTAEIAARWFHSPNAAGSAHLSVDDKECYRSLPDKAIAWGAPGANMKGFHIEMAGYAKWSGVIWFTHKRALDRAAYKAALHCKKFGIPVRFVDAAGLKNGVAGITTHAECSKAFGGSHWDPGPGWPRRWFIKRVRFYFNEMESAL